MRLAHAILCAFLVTCHAFAQDAATANELLQRATNRLFSLHASAVADSERVVTQAREQGDHELHARALCVYAPALLEKGRLTEARKHIEDAVDICARHLDEPMMGSANLVFAFWHARHGDMGRSEQHLKRAQLELGDAATPRQLAEIKLLFGLAELTRGAHPEGVPHMYEALELARTHGVADVEAQVDIALAMVAERQESLDAGDEHAIAANNLIAAHDYGLLAPANAFAQAKLAHRRKRNVALQRSLMKRCVELAEATQHPKWLAEADRFRGHIAHWLDQDEERALEFYVSGIPKAQRADDIACLGYMTVLAAQIHQENSRAAEAIALLDSTSEQVAPCNDARLRVLTNRIRAQAYAALGQFEEAYAAAWIAADTDRWLARHESTGELLTHIYLQREDQHRQATVFWVVVATLALGATILLLRQHSLLRSANRELETALSQVRELRGLLPICAQCKAIRDDAGYWHRIENYLTHHSKASLSHGICPSCADDLYPDLTPGLRPPKEEDKPDSEAI